jgi:aconitate hydratase
LGILQHLLDARSRRLGYCRRRCARQPRSQSAVTESSLDSFKSRKSLAVGGKAYDIYSLPEAEKNGLAGIARLPFSLKVLLENLLRSEDGRSVTADDIIALLRRK